ncbi:SURP and G-patch domain-containing protein 1-like protein isoform X2 [Prosopis cineraria]|uniref:SURP and G-patch domain-containing protein 1-like protein isoform X2 n=1 Tax=Prosopis cineraria TaxID=364024 RepID=UPI002410717B|nr:SURP and G-patch domain-containing protein 1-like protein isoform X2 [Prosopis cineraria]XP_054812779.1 SURP and G-patch domain-containing protein 1-like protein isoform X2 [Prosopis cineraria]
MDKGAPPSLFVNDGSFMERFKQLQQEQEKDKDAKLKEPKPIKIVSGSLTSNLTIKKNPVNSKANDSQKTAQASSNGKLAFSLKQKSKLVPPPVVLSAEEDEEETNAGDTSSDVPSKRQKLNNDACTEQSSRRLEVAPPSPSDPTVKKVADKLASFVAKNGRQFEDVTRQKNPGDTPFKFLFDEKCADYKYYQHRLAQEEKALAQSKESQESHNGSTSTSSSKSTTGSQRTSQQQSTYQIPASALYQTADEPGAVSNADSLARMEFYMMKAAQEERRRQPKQSKDEMPPPACLQAPAKKGHHMGDYIPPEELEKFLATCNDAAAQKAAKEAAEKAKIQADNVGHKLLSKMGWKEGALCIPLFFVSSAQVHLT